MKSKIVITDIGSTTTKAILLMNKEGKLKLIGSVGAGTTVESPWEDVKIGVYNSIKGLEIKTNQRLLAEASSAENLKFQPDVDYLTTSSAGGGLQILVMGLTLSDSAKSAERAAYGAGGVILNTLAINDKRSTYEQLTIINKSHPDIILLSGGTDGGAYTGVIRMSEILALGKPSPKFSQDDRIPLIYAGNQDVKDFIATLFSSNFNLKILDNIRPEMDVEKLDQITETIHELFLSSVMEQAPGYSGLKAKTASDILPTPVAVLTSLDLIRSKVGNSILKVDIGGATTDMFSVIKNHTSRTVSANYGMSYSISNVLANYGWEELDKLIPKSLDQRVVRNYIGNKMLNPTYVPKDDIEICIEQAVAIAALRLSMEQHYEMHFNTVKIGFLEHVKSVYRDPFYDQMHQEKIEEESKFHHSDIQLAIGAGGVISHAPKAEQAMYVIAQGFKVEGITKIWRDHDFISPHLGVFSKVEKSSSIDLLMNDCYEELGTVIVPKITSKKDNFVAMTLTIDGNMYPIKVNQSRYFKLNKEQEVHVKLHSNCLIKDKDSDFTLKVNKSLLVTSYQADKINYKDVIKEMNLYNFTTENIEIINYMNRNEIVIKEGHFSDKVQLPYEGKILASKGYSLGPNDNYGVNEYSFPKIYIISLAKLLGKDFNYDYVRNNLNLRPGDVIKYGQTLIGNAESPVKGIVKDINYTTGTILAKELQDYTTKPVTIKIAKQIGVKNKHLKGYLAVKKDEFVFEGKILNRFVAGKTLKIVQAPISGNIIDINLEEGSLTIQYLKTPYYHKIGLECQIEKVHDNGVEYSYNGIEIQGIIGFGSQNNGLIDLVDEITLDNDLSDKMIAFNGKASYNDLKTLENNNIKGLIVPSIDNLDLVKFIGKDIGVALTGDEDIPYPIFVMKGFGDYKFTDQVISIFKKYRNHNCLLIPNTQIRAGVTRPKIIINK